jgi:TetR/AcrR family transcriptional regulator, cholesterol catabolism regulator
MAQQPDLVELPPAPTEPLKVRPDIIAAATRVFSEHGYHAATMSQIADAVGMRKPSLYHHVRKKEDLLFAIHEQLIDELIGETLSAASAGQTPSDKLRAVIRVTMGFIARHRDEVTVFLQERRAVSGSRWTELVMKRDFYEQLVTRIITEGSENKLFVDLPPAIVARAVLGMANWGYTWFQPDGPLTADEVADVIAQIALKGLEVR